MTEFFMCYFWFIKKTNIMIFNQIFTFLLVFFASLFNAQLDDKFYQPSKKMQPFEMKISEIIYFPVEKDTITAYISQSEIKDLKKTILFFHGAGGNVTTYQYISKPLVEAGYKVVMVDVRGYGKSTGIPSHENIKNDTQKLFDYLITKPEIKNTKIYIYGASLGSQVAAHLAKNNKEKLSGLIIDGGMSSFADVATLFAPQYAQYIEQILKGVYQSKEDLKFTQGLPKLFIYNKKDATVPFLQGQTNFANAAEPKTFLEAGNEHIQAMKDEESVVLKAISNL